MILYYRKKKEGETSKALLERALLSYCRELGKKVPRKKNRIPAAGQNGKPYYPVLSSVFFNISHTGDLWVCVFDKHPVGVDIERIDRGAKAEAIAKRFFTEEEQTYLRNTENPEEAFIRLWTRKESYVKYTGEGLQRGLQTFSVLNDRMPGFFETEGEVKLPEWVVFQDAPIPESTEKGETSFAGICCTVCGAAGEIRVLELPDSNPEDAVEDAKAIALAYLETRMRTEKEIADKLREKDVPEHIASEVMAFLREYHLIDDRAYAERAVEAELGKGRGPIRIRQDLMRKGLSSELIREALERASAEAQENQEAKDVFCENAENIARKVWEQAGSPKEPDDKLDARILRKLASRGYPAGMAYKALSVVKEQMNMLK